MSKFNKGDKILGKNCEGLGMYAGKTYTVKTCTESEMTLEECLCKETGRSYTFTPSMYELIEKRNYREMKPTDLIKISIDGNESEVPIGDLVHTTALLGVSNGRYGLEIWDALTKTLGECGFPGDLDILIEFRENEKKALDYFFQPYYDKQQEKDELKTLIASKMEEVDSLVKQLNQLNQM